MWNVPSIAALTSPTVPRILVVMRCRRPITVILFAAALSVASPVNAQHHELGTVSFPTSCSAAVQADFETGVAMLHSYWFNYAGKQFRGVLEKDPA